MLARAPRAILSTALIALAGCLFLVAVAPFAKMVAVQHAVRRSARLLAADRPKDALTLLQRFEPWAYDFPVLVPEHARQSVRCNARLYRLAAAKRGADFIYALPSRPGAPAPSFRRDGIRALVLGWPNRMANSLVVLGGGSKSGCTPVSGYLDICEELRRMAQYDEIVWLGKETLRGKQGKQGKQGMKPLEDYVLWAEAMVEAQNRELHGDDSSAVTRAQPQDRPALQRRLRGPEPDKPLGADARKRKTERSADETHPSREIHALGSTVGKPQNPPPSSSTAEETPVNAKSDPGANTPRPAASEADRNYAAAITRYNGAVDAHLLLEKELGTATGARRSELLDEIRISKGNVVTLKAEMQKAKAAAEAKGR